MTGKSHLIAGTALTVTAGITVSELADAIITRFPQTEPYYQRILHKIYLDNLGVNILCEPKQLLLFGIGILLLYFGFLLPDIDDSKSLISKFLRKSFLFKYLVQLLNQLKHHHWTHTIWFVLPELIAGWFCPVFWYMGFGYFIHLFLDSFGAMGNCYLYPNYIQYPNGAQVKRGHKIKLYHTNSISEYICVFLLCLLAGALLAVKLYL